MSDIYVNSVDLNAPVDFPAGAFESVYRQVSNKATSDMPRYEEGFTAFGSSWRSLLYWYRTACEHSDAFRDSIQQHGDGPPQPTRYYQEKHLFGFFTYGIAALESCCYACFAIGAMDDPITFSMANPRSITLKKTVQTLESFLPANQRVDQSLLDALRNMRNSNEYKEFELIRNILAHRGVPPRALKVSTSRIVPAPGAEWRTGFTLVLDAQTTVRKRTWLAAQLDTLLHAADKFTASL